MTTPERVKQFCKCLIRRSEAERNTDISGFIVVRLDISNAVDQVYAVHEDHGFISEDQSQDHVRQRVVGQDTSMRVRPLLFVPLDSDGVRERPKQKKKLDGVE
jgi:hypothetical protein